ncbi:MAG: PAS domain S-box protein [Gemmatimonadales bacterium]
MTPLGVIMVVDDDDDLRESICEVLEDEGFRTVGVAHGAAALEDLRSDRRKPDLILLDLMMPTMNGWQFRREQKRDPSLADIPVVVMTARRDVNDISAAEIIYKPVTREKLRETVRRWTDVDDDGEGGGSAPRDAGGPPSGSPASGPPGGPQVAFLQLPLPVCVLRGRALVCEIANRAFLEMAGRTEVAGLPLTTVLPELGARGIDAMLGEVVRSGRACTAEEVPLGAGPRGAETAHWTLTCAPLDFGGRVERVVLCAQDVTHQVRARRGLEQSEGTFRRIVTQIQAGLAQTDLEGRFCLTNEAFRQIVGRTEQELRQARIHDILHPEDLEASLARVDRLVADGTPVVLEHRFVKPDGSIVWAQSSLSRIEGPDGRAPSIAAVTTDVTRRRYADEAYAESEDRLRASEARVRHLLAMEEGARREAESLYRVAQSLTQAHFDLQALVQSATDHATELVGAAFGAFFYNVVNERGETYLLHTLSGAPKEAFSEFGLPRNTPLFATTFTGQGVLRLDDVTADARYGQVPPHHGMPEGHLPVTSYLAVPVISGSEEVLGGLFFGHPEPARFTERHERMVVAIAANAAIAIDNARLHQATRASEERFRQIFETSDISIWEEDFTEVQTLVEELARRHGDGLRAYLEAHPEVVREAIGLVRIRDVNPATLRLFGASEKAELLSSLHAVFLPETECVFIEEMLALAEGRQFFSSEEAVRTLRGERLDLMITITFPPRGERAERVFATIVDISGRKAAERERESRLAEAERALAFSERFVGILGHDLRNPLAAIVSSAEVLLLSDVSERLARPVQRIYGSAERMSRMIEQILDLTRARLGEGITIEPTPFDLRDLTSQIVEELEGAAPQPMVFTAVADTRGVWDRDRLGQVISNLVGNAAEHGDVTQPIRVELDGSRSDAIRLEVWNGGAVPTEVLPTLFDPFRTAATGTTSNKARGLGLGLFIVQQIAEAHGGTIEVRSSAEAGTTFAVTLPRGTSSASASSHSHSTPAIAT